MNDEHEYVKFKDVDVIALGDMAVLLRLDDKGVLYWIPYSQIEDNNEQFVAGETLNALYITKWICDKKGLEI